MRRSRNEALALIYYDWISKVHGYGLIKHTDETIPWMKFHDPYSLSKPKPYTRFRKGVPFPYPQGGEWDELVENQARATHVDSAMENSTLNGNRFATTETIRIQFEQNMEARMHKVHAIIDEFQDKTIRETKVRCVAALYCVGQANYTNRSMRNYADAVSDGIGMRDESDEPIVTDDRINQVTAEQNGQQATALLDDPEWLSSADALSVAVIKEIKMVSKFTQEQLDRFARAVPPKTYEEAMKREDAELWIEATNTELSESGSEASRSLERKRHISHCVGPE